jgi:hypothetical protein
MLLRSAIVVTTLLLAVACSRGTTIETREVDAACGLCIYKQQGKGGCHWAVDIDGRIVSATGPAVPTNEQHDAHGPDGMCNMKRRVIIEGTLEDKQFYATRFELKPAENVPTHPAHEHKH